MADVETSLATLKKELPAVCERCGYSLRGRRDGEGRCPECGSVYGGETLVLRPVALRRGRTSAGFFGAAIVLAVLIGFVSLVTIEWSYVLYVTAGHLPELVLLVLILLSPALICTLAGLYLHFRNSFNHALRLTDREIRLEQMGKARARIQYELLGGFTLRATAAGQWELRMAATGNARYETMVIFHASDQTAEAIRTAIDCRMAGLAPGAGREIA